MAVSAEVDTRSQEKRGRGEEGHTCDAFTEKLANLISKENVNTILSEQESM